MWTETALTEIASSPMSASRSLVFTFVFVGAKVTVRAKVNAVNSVFLVQVKKNERGLSRINLVRRNLAKVLLKRVGPGFSARTFLGKII